MEVETPLKKSHHFLVVFLLKQSQVIQLISICMQSINWIQHQTIWTLVSFPLSPSFISLQELSSIIEITLTKGHTWNPNVFSIKPLSFQTIKNLHQTPKTNPLLGDIQTPLVPKTLYPNISRSWTHLNLQGTLTLIVFLIVWKITHFLPSSPIYVIVALFDESVVALYFWDLSKNPENLFNSKQK